MDELCGTQKKYKLIVVHHRSICQNNNIAEISCYIEALEHFNSMLLEQYILRV